MASMAVRATLLNGSCSVSDQPEVWQCVRSAMDFGFFGLNWLTIFSPQEPCGTHLGDFHEVVHAHAPEK